jgi:hypothetical protein
MLILCSPVYCIGVLILAQQMPGQRMRAGKPEEADVLIFLPPDGIIR